MGSFETRDDEKQAHLRPLRVAVRREDVYAEAKTMVGDLAGWTLVQADDQALVLHCERRAGLLGGAAKVTVKVEGPDGIPSATVSLRCESDSGLFARDKAIVREFLEPFSRRVG